MSQAMQKMPDWTEEEKDTKKRDFTERQEEDLEPEIFIDFFIVSVTFFF